MHKDIQKMQFQVEGKIVSIFVGEKALGSSHHLLGGDVHFVVDSNVYRFHEEILLPIIGKHHLHVFTSSEKTKILKSLEMLVNALLASGAGRNSTLVAVGGGVLGDLCGLLASVYMRGMNLVMIPTTLLAMVDSSLGGKNGVNVNGKNMVGTIYQPSTVIVDPVFLTTLPEREIRAGLAEVIKYGCIRDSDILSMLTKSKTVDSALLTRCIRSKMEVVVEDPTEKNLRSVLNFGHTVGHAIEAVTQYKRYVHGEAVALGMVVEAQLAHKMGILSEQDVSLLHGLITSCGLETTLPEDISRDKLIVAMGNDKKRREGNGIPFVIVSKLGEMRSVKGKYVHMVSEHTVRSVL